MNPIIFVVYIVFTLITVLISVVKIGKIASNISSIKAVRYTEVNELRKRNIKKSVYGAKINRMELSNIFRSSNKFVVVIASLSVSIILLNVVYTVISNLDITKYLSK